MQAVTDVVWEVQYLADAGKKLIELVAVTGLHKGRDTRLRLMHCLCALVTILFDPTILGLVVLALAAVNITLIFALTAPIAASIFVVALVAVAGAISSTAAVVLTLAVVLVVAFAIAIIFVVITITVISLRSCFGGVDVGPPLEIGWLPLGQLSCLDGM
jgi:hypothetical protein